MTATRWVRCPTCRQPTPYADTNRWRPFCSARCRGVDLGGWANEDYRVAAEPPADVDSDAPAAVQEGIGPDTRPDIPRRGPQDAN